MNEDFKQLIESHGWLSIPSKNPYMVSYRHEETGERMNIYFTTMTITIQPEKGSRCDTYKNVDIEKLEEILTR